LNAYAERWVRSVKEGALSQLIRFGERSLRYALTEFVTHVHQQRSHQGKDHLVLMPTVVPAPVTTSGNAIRCRERRGGLLQSYDARRHRYRDG
jgi:putative transposase